MLKQKETSIIRVLHYVEKDAIIHQIKKYLYFFGVRLSALQISSIIVRIAENQVFESR